ncbi:MAG: CPBP family intramembrane metalloprotease [Burkholderiaceae bacterium]|nr:CPBP family intramembrane metalloprotease [Burkholderiaceae bacterium]
MAVIVAKTPTDPLRFRAELADFIAFLKHPTLGPRTPGRRTGRGITVDWLPGVSIKRLLQWAGLLWTLNLIFLGPIAVMAAGAGGAQHRLNLDAIPWLMALLWAPLVEELMFRYSLRRVAHALWMLPAAAVVMFSGPGWSTGLLLLAVLLMCWRPGAGRPFAQRQGRTWRLLLNYRRVFPWVFHGASLAFAGIHLVNFNLHQMAWWLMPLLVLPQWLTGLVLGWLRVRRGIGASVLLHAIFNGGPLLVVWMILRLNPGIVS